MIDSVASCEVSCRVVGEARGLVVLELGVDHGTYVGIIVLILVEGDPLDVLIPDDTCVDMLGPATHLLLQLYI